jgi:hypothetical protein
MPLPKTAQTAQPWRIHELTREFGLEDVWALPTPGGPDDFPRLLELFASFDASHSDSALTRALFSIRWKLGALLGWDGDGDGDGDPASPRPTLRERLPSDLRGTANGLDFADSPFTPLYRTDDEWAAEIANRTVHGVVHLGWVEDPGVGYRGQMAVYVKRNGLLGAAYMAAIAPFRHLIVYPALLGEMGRRWRPDPAGS